MSQDTICRARSLIAILLLSSLASCAMPPREAWRIVQTQGLFAYLSGDYYVPGHGQPTRYMASGSPLQPRHLYQQQVASHRFEPVYREQRYVRPPPGWVGPYGPPPPTTPFAPPRTITPYSPPVAATPKPEPRITAPAPQHPPATPAAPSKSAVADKLPLTPPPPAAVNMDQLPYGTAIPGRPGMVNSPYAQKQQLVDVTGMPAGQPVKCPYTGKLFRVPPTQQAATTQPLEPATKPTPETKPQSR